MTDSSFFFVWVFFCVFFLNSACQQKADSLSAVKLVKEYWTRKHCAEELIFSFRELIQIVRDTSPPMKYFAFAEVHAFPQWKRETHIEARLWARKRKVCPQWGFVDLSSFTFFCKVQY